MSDFFRLMLNDTYGHTDSIRAAKFTPDCKSILSCDDDNTRIWDVESKELIYIFSGAGAKFLDISSDGKYFLSGGSCIEVHDIQERIRTRGPPKKDKNARSDMFFGHAISSAQFSPDNRYIVAGSVDSTVRLLDMKTRRLLHIFNNPPPEDFDWGLYMRLYSSPYDRDRPVISHRGGVGSVAFSSDGKLISSTDNYQAKLWDMETMECLHVFEYQIEENDDPTPRVVAFTPDGEFIAIGEWHGSIFLFNLADYSMVHEFKGHECWEGTTDGEFDYRDAYPHEITFSPDGKYMATASEDHTCRLWDMETRECLHVFDDFENAVTTASFSPDSKSLVIGSEDRTLKLYSTTDFSLIHSFSGKSPNPYVTDSKLVDQAYKLIKQMHSQIYEDEEYDRPPSTYSHFTGDPYKDECWLSVYNYDKKDFLLILRESIKGWVDHGDGWAKYQRLTEDEKVSYQNRVNEFMGINIIDLSPLEITSPYLKKIVIDGSELVMLLSAYEPADYPHAYKKENRKHPYNQFFRYYNLDKITCQLKERLPVTYLKKKIGFETPLWELRMHFNGSEDIIKLIYIALDIHRNNIEYLRKMKHHLY